MFIRPLVFTFPYAILFWGIQIWIGMAEVKIPRSRAESSASRDRGSRMTLLLGMQVATMLAFALAFVRSTGVPIVAMAPLFWIGQAMILAGALLRRHCWNLLGEFFTGDIHAEADQPVIDRGPYRWVRHPSYSGGMLMSIGMGVALGNWASLLTLTIASVALYSRRVFVEESALIDAMGERYLSYRSRTKRFVPFVF